MKFIGPYISATKAGLMIQLDENTVKRLKKINWAYSKRFIFGSLLLFTRDNCTTFIVATILDRDVNCLAQGKVMVYFSYSFPRKVVMSRYVKSLKVARLRTVK